MADTQDLFEWQPDGSGDTFPLLRPDKFDSLICCAARQEGKTTLIRYLVKQIVRKTRPRDGGFDLIFVFSNSRTTLDDYKKFVPWLLPGKSPIDPSNASSDSSDSGDSGSYDGSDRDTTTDTGLPQPVNFIHFETAGAGAIEKLVRVQEADRSGTRVLVILDDVLTSDLKYNDHVNRFFTQGRHSRIAVWLISQGFTSALSTTVRKNTDIMIFLRTRSGTEAKTIQDEVLAGTLHPSDIGSIRLPESGIVPTKERELLRGVLAECTSEYRAMVVDARQKKTRMALMVHTFKVPKRYVD